MKTPDPENPDPENPDPENPDPENPDPENPDPENPDAGTSQTEEPENPENPENPLLEEIRNDALAKAPVQAGGGYRLDFTHHNGGPLVVRPAADAETVTGTFIKSRTNRRSCTSRSENRPTPARFRAIRTPTTYAKRCSASI